MINQNFSPNGYYPYKFYASPPTIASILFFDVIADKALSQEGYLSISTYHPKASMHSVTHIINFQGRIYIHIL